VTKVVSRNRVEAYAAQQWCINCGEIGRSFRCRICPHLSKSTASPLAMTNTPKILIVEDDDIQAAVLLEAVREAGYLPLREASAAGVIACVYREKPVAVLMDLRLPDQHGFDLCRELRTSSTVPVIMVTAQDEALDRLVGLEVGADDYIVKPFNVAEVLARLKAVLRRTQGSWAQNQEAQKKSVLQLDDASFIASWRGVALGLTRIEYQLLKRLARHPGHVLSRNQLLDAIYDHDRVINDRTIDSHIKNLRRKLQSAHTGASWDPIESVYGIGYRFVASD
jgi:two-component system, OmpR family, response regulator BaeR